MAGDIDLQILNDMEFGRAYFSKDGDLHASDRGGFCPFDHPSKLLKPLNVVHDGQLKQLMLSADVTGKIIAFAESIALTDKLIENQRLHARRFKMNRMRYATRVR